MRFLIIGDLSDAVFDSWGELVSSRTMLHTFLDFLASLTFLCRYGHGFEIFCEAASPDGSLLASACKVCA